MAETRALSTELEQKIDAVLGVDAPLSRRVRDILQRHSLLVIERYNRDAFMVADDAMVYAEMIARGGIILEHVAWHRVLIDSTSKKEYGIFNLSESNNAALTNFGGPTVSNNELYFFKSFAVSPETDYSQADLEALLKHTVLTIEGPQNKAYIDRRPIDRLPAGKGLDGLLNSGHPTPGALFRFQRWLRWGPQEPTRAKIATVHSAGDVPSVTNRHIRVDAIGFKCVW